ncbi:MAG: hypothetical protein IKM21_00850 [Oscillospiraceae bacterium]|nr:hypothetical protein [Oscillospiraceae bacterium]
MYKLFGRERGETDKKMSDFAFKTKITLSFLTIFACIAVMLSTAFALFSSTTEYSAELKSATWRIYVENNGVPVSGRYLCTQAENGSDTHSFTISPSGTPGASGYCIITIYAQGESPAVHYTDNFSSDINVNITAATGCEITFTPHWGSPENFGVPTLRGNSIFHSVTPEEPIDEELAEDSVPEGSPDSESGEPSSEGSNDAPKDETSDIITDISSSFSDIFDIFGDSNKTEDTFTPSDSVADNGGYSTPSDSPTDSGSDSAPSDNPTDSGSDPTPSDNPTDSGSDSAPSDNPTDSGSDSAPSDSPTDSGSDSAPSDNPTDSGSDSAPSDSPTDSGSDSAPSDNTGSVDIAPPPSSSGSGSESSSSSDGGSSAPSGDSGSSSSASSGGSDSGSSAPSGDGE